VEGNSESLGTNFRSKFKIKNKGNVNSFEKMISRVKMNGFEEACSEEVGLSGKYHKNLVRLARYQTDLKTLKVIFS
jgi:hypothetical protein